MIHALMVLVWIYLIVALLIAGFMYLVLWQAYKSSEDNDPYALELREYSEKIMSRSGFSLAALCLWIGICWPVVIGKSNKH